jgi:thioredoxin reductase (NADPH)
MSDLSDCIVIGAGPAGLTAATYLLRYHRAVVLMGRGSSRAAYIRKTRNIPGYPRGVQGPALLTDLREQARQHGAQLVPQRARRLTGELGAFTLHTDEQIFRARTVLLCTGVRDRLPASLQGQWRAVSTGCVRLCPICDAYEFSGEPLCVLGSSEKTAREALFLRSYSGDVTVLSDGRPSSAWSGELHELLTALRVRIDERPIRSIQAGPTRVTMSFADGGERSARALYIALGCDVSSELAAGLGAETDDEGFLKVDQHQQTTVPGLYAAGDLVQSLSQIAVAFGQAAIAATAVHNSLRELAKPFLKSQGARCRAGAAQPPAQLRS